MFDEYSTETLPHLLARWGRDEITVEQLAGYLLQHVIGHEQRIAQLEKALLGRSQVNPPDGGDTSKR